MLIRILVLVTCIFLIFAIPMNANYVGFDELGVAFFAEHRSPAWTRFFLWITHMGSTWGFLAVFLFIILYYFFQQRWAAGIFFLVAVGLLKLSGPLLKIMVGRPRPDVGMLAMKTLSMPSGHAMNAVLIYGILAILILQKVKSGLLRFFGVFLCLIMLLLTDLSRVYLGVHYPSDVLMGSLYAASSLWFLQGLKKDFLSF